MKLIDLLIQELPKRGGWPEGAVEAGFLCSNTTLYFVDANGDCPSEWRIEMHSEVEDNDIEISKDQYEAALSAPQNVEWDGKVLPPVGMHCEVVDHDGALMYGQGESGEVVAHVENTAVIRMSYGLGFFEARYLRPIRTEAERKRDAFINAVLDDMRTIPCDLSLRDEVAVIYDAIAAGKIPGVKLDD